MDLNKSNIKNIRLEIKRGMEYNIDKFNNIFNSTEYPIAILNINLGNILCIIFNIVYLILILKSNKNFHEYHKLTLYSFYALSMLYVLNNDKTLNHIMNNIQICKFAPYLIIFRTLIYIYLTFLININ